MLNKPSVKKGNYLGNQTKVVKFRTTPDTFELFEKLASKENLCLALFVRKLVMRGLDSLLIEIKAFR